MVETNTAGLKKYETTPNEGQKTLKLYEKRSTTGPKETKIRPVKH